MNPGSIECEIFAFQGEGPAPMFMNENRGMCPSCDALTYMSHMDLKWPASDALKTLCTVHADMSNVRTTIDFGPRGLYKRQLVSVVLSLGLTELKAHLAWIDEDVRSLTYPGAHILKTLLAST